MHLLDKLKKEYKKQSGYITLISVLVVSAAGMVIAISVILLGNAFAQSSLTIIQSAQAKALANVCAEYGLERMVASNFTGTGNLTEDGGTCTYEVASQGGETRTVMAVSNVDGKVRKVRIVISDILPDVIISSWQEVAD